MDRPGARTAAPIAYAAVVGIPIPSIRATSAAKIIASNWLAPAIPRIISEKRPPIPVSATTPTMIPAQAQTATSWIVSRAARFKASSVFLVPKSTTKASTTAPPTTRPDQLPATPLSSSGPKPIMRLAIPPIAIRETIRLRNSLAKEIIGVTRWPEPSSRSPNRTESHPTISAARIPRPPARKGE